MNIIAVKFALGIAVALYFSYLQVSALRKGVKVYTWLADFWCGLYALLWIAQVVAILFVIISFK